MQHNWQQILFTVVFVNTLTNKIEFENGKNENVSQII